MLKIKADQETEINGNGPEVTEAQLQSTQHLYQA